MHTILVFTIIYICLELLWYMYIDTKKISFEQHITHPVSLERKLQVFDRILRWTKDPEKFVRGFFFDIKIEDITYEDIAEWLCWAFFDKEHPDKDDKLILNYMIDKISQLCNRQFPHRTNRRNKFMAYSIEPYDCGYNMLLIYTITMCIYPISAFIYLTGMGFKQIIIKNIRFWILRKNNDKTPIVLIHGLGGGIFPYCDFITSLLQLEATIIIPDLPFLCMYMDDNVPDDDVIILAIKNAIENIHSKAIIIGHSYGTVIMSWIIQEYPYIVERAVLLDPVVFMLHLADLGMNFLYKKREYDTLGIIRSDPFINWILRRHFWWLSSILWLEDLENIPYLVVLCMKDQILPTQEIKEYIEGYSKQQNLICFEDLHHGGFLYDKEAIEKILFLFS